MILLFNFNQIWKCPMDVRKSNGVSNFV